MKSRWEGILASIFLGFWWVLVAKLGRKTEPRGSRDRTRQDRTGQDKGRHAKVKTRQDKILVDQDRDRGFAPGGKGLPDS